MGGLGNQMFQYAFGRANEYDTRYTLSWFEKTKNIHRPYRLDKFKTKIIIHDSIKNTIYEKNTRYNPEFLKKNGFNFVGYWQFYPYFKHILPELREHLVVKEEFYTDEYLKFRDHIVNSNSISVHVRRGDYLTQKGFHDLPIHYYIRAMSEMKGRFFVFSDDIPWCRDKFDKYFISITYVDIEDYLSFELMRLCRKNIITNSTFSYWAAMLNNNPGKVVICPYKWLGDTIPNDNTRFPEDWIKISDYVIQDI